MSSGKTENTTTHPTSSSFMAAAAGVLVTMLPFAVAAAVAYRSKRSSSSSSDTTQQQTRKNTTTPQPHQRPHFVNNHCELYDACLEMDWDRAESMLGETDQEERRRIQLCMYQEGDNLETPLFMACQNRPPASLIRQLLDVCPEAAKIKSRHGDLPIHIACRYQADASVIKLLVQRHPETSCQITRYGMTPLMAFWEKQHIQMNTASVWTGSAPGTIAKKLDSIPHNDVESEYAWEVTGILVEAVAAAATTYRRQQNIDHQNDDVDPEQHQHHQRSPIIDDAGAADGPSAMMTTTSTPMMVHAIVGLGVLGYPLHVLFYTFKTYGQEQACLKDVQGRLPLHIVIGRPDPNLNLTEKFRKNKPPREYWAIALCLYFYPQSAQIPDPTEPVGRYPLHTALKNGHEWNEGIRNIVLSAPHVLHIPDPVSGLFPFQIPVSSLSSTRTSSFSSNRNSKRARDRDVELSSLETAFRLLRSDPSVIETARRTAMATTQAAVRSKSIVADDEKAATTGIDDEKDDSIPISKRRRRRQRHPYVSSTAHEIVSGAVLLGAACFLALTPSR